jgi:plastocyanin
MESAARVGARLLLGAGLCALAVACGKGTTTPSTPPTATNLITITSSGVSPKSIIVQRGSQVTFVNNDSRTHDMQSNPHPEHSDCPELAQVGFLRVGGSRQSGNLNIAMTCGYHDNQNEGNTSLQGTILVQ